MCFFFFLQLSVPAGLGSTAYHQTGGFSHPVLGPVGPGLTQYPGAYGAMGAITGLPSAVAPGIGLHRDPRSLTKQPSESVKPVQVPDHSTNKDQGARNCNCFCFPTGHALDSKEDCSTCHA